MLSFCVLFLSFRCWRGPTRWILKGPGSVLFNKWLVHWPDQWPCQRRILKHFSVFTWAHGREATALWSGYGNVSVPDVFRLQKWIWCLCWWRVLYVWEGEKMYRPGRVPVSWCLYSAESPGVCAGCGDVSCVISKSCSSADGDVCPSWGWLLLLAVAGVFHSILFIVFVAFSSGNVTHAFSRVQPAMVQFVFVSCNGSVCVCFSLTACNGSVCVCFSLTACNGSVCVCFSLTACNGSVCVCFLGFWTIGCSCVYRSMAI